MQDKIVYNKKIVATKENYKEASKEYEKIIKEAPKVQDYPNQNVVVKHSFVITGETISIADLLAKHGINNQKKTVTQSPPNLQNEEENDSSTSLNSI